ncbi:hypothetical protein WS46_19205 [Burkholderia sp. RF4-BP95]|nr:hypothetical protein WS46_19205 [Burkholderia sp. RF4-BP95]
MSARIAPAAPSHKARGPPGAWRRCAARDASRCSQAQMWCAAALSPCDIAVRDDGARCTSMRHRVRRVPAAACVPASVARGVAPRMSPRSPPR